MFFMGLKTSFTGSKGHSDIQEMVQVLQRDGQNYCQTGLGVSELAGPGNSAY